MPTRSLVVLACLASTSQSAIAGELPPPPGHASSATIAAGRELFTMNFAKPSEEKFPRGLGHNGNGLGPLFNETSCVACHNQGGPGGGGSLEHNVDVLGIVIEGQPKGTASQIVRDAQAVHPGLSENKPLLLVQRFAAGDSRRVEAYDAWRDSFFAAFERPSNSMLPRRRSNGVATVELVQRNTPALWGSGEIESLRQAGGDEIRRRLADEITAKKPWITGRPPISLTGDDGWYGWRGQVASLDGIVRGACASELGIQVEGAAESTHPLLEERPVRGRKSATKTVDLTEQQIHQLVSFVSELPRPVRRTPDASNSQIVMAGEKAFESVGCADCHVPDLGSVKGMYSDQLLHDMGPQTSDVQISAPLRRTRTVTRSQAGLPSGGGYYEMGGSVTTLMQDIRTTEVTGIVPTRRAMEWKTPPLWGVRDSYPYFHDGRAPTLKDAIRMHGGEAEKSAQEFNALDEASQNALITFLESLTLPAEQERFATR
ncbi:Cytochrome c [Caulifigura coniformis]|uniref:Cytochrome c n=1 Tax=Caulifigura coniformis TaxID=2527983 RepID=A0A517SL66_9PLAN|nr:di-heme oxidoredictase family protein [Caulifigura coniformis]QDT56867.1 Cytochrome c [Caulifigura coniformis]